MKKNICKVTSLVLVLSLLLAVVTVFPAAEQKDAGDSLKVFYNRGFEDGWDYGNGMNKDYKYDLDVYLTYTKLSVSKYDYYMHIAPGSDVGGYLGIPLGSESPTAGKVHLEFDFRASPGNNIGGIVMVADNSEDLSLSHVVSLKDGSLYLLGEKICDVPTVFTKIGFTFDYDYCNTTGAGDDEYQVYAYLDGELAATRVYRSEGFGLSYVYFGAQENFTGADRCYSSLQESRDYCS